MAAAAVTSATNMIAMAGGTLGGGGGGAQITFQLDECYAFLMTDIIILSHKKVSLLDDKTVCVRDLAVYVAVM